MFKRTYKRDKNGRFARKQYVVSNTVVAPTYGLNDKLAGLSIVTITLFVPFYALFLTYAK